MKNTTFLKSITLTSGSCRYYSQLGKQLETLCTQTQQHLQKITAIKTEMSHWILLLSPLPNNREESSEAVNEPVLLLCCNDDLRMIFWWGYSGAGLLQSYCMFYRGTGVSLALWSLCGQYTVGSSPQDKATLILKMLLQIFLSTSFTYFILVLLLFPMKRKYIVKFNQVSKTKGKKEKCVDSFSITCKSEYT